MDGIAAIEARVAEICARFAPPPPPTIGATDGAFAAHLRRAMGTGSAAPVTGAGQAPGNVDAWITEAIARTGVPASWAPALRTIAFHESSFNPAAANLTAAG